MIIKKILNNNAIITYDESGAEIIVMGRGIAYGKSTGQEIDEKRIYKKFELQSKESKNKLIEFLQEIPTEYIEISEKIIEYAKSTLNIKFDDSLYIKLTDHIFASINRYKEGIILKNKLIFDIKCFYKKEFEVGVFALDLIKQKYGIEMKEDEACFIALHIVSSEIGNDLKDVYEITSFIQEIIKIVKYNFGIEFDRESLSYYRFITHLKFFGQRVFSQIKSNEEESLSNDLLEMMKEKYVQAYLCSLKIKEYIEEQYAYFLDADEILYLTIHIAKVTQGK